MSSIHLTLTSIDRFGKKCKFFEIQDGGRRHRGFRNMLIISASMMQFLQNFSCIYLVSASIDYVAQTWTFSKIQDGGRRHLGLRSILIISAWMKQFSPNFNCIYLVSKSIDYSGQNGNFIQWKMDNKNRKYEFKKLSSLS